MAEPAQNTGDIRKDFINLQVYTGADGRFTLYQDEGDCYRYEEGLYATIEFSWQEAAGELTIHQRKGNYPGMPESIAFLVAGLSLNPLSIVYHGDKMIVRVE